ncbi:MAG TPA: EAL domain-containing protein [Solirubrobacteraceae bacterium]|nr:EAL domain-containing protein [Solirubrobacteraceae bacterium]
MSAVAGRRSSRAPAAPNGAPPDWRARAEQAEEALRSIRAGEIDALVLATPEGDRVFTLHSAEEPYRIMLEQMSEGAASLSAERVVLYANRRLADLLGLPLSALVGEPIESFVAPELRERARALFSSDGVDDRRSDQLTMLAADGGDGVDVQVSVTPLPDQTESAWCLVATDISAQMLRQGELEDRVIERTHQLMDADHRYRKIVETASEGVWTIDLAHRTTFVNRALARMLGYEPGEMIGRPVSDFVDPTLAGTAAAQLARNLAGDSGQQDVPLRARDGRPVWTLISAGPLTTNDGRIVGAMALITDITERKQMETRILHMASHDPLTGIPNRRRLIDTLDEQLQATPGGRPFALIMLDLDNFKFANDTYGHASGDAMLKATADTLTARTRPSDLVARVGGDEFAVVLSDSTEADALAVARHIQKFLSEVGFQPPITASFGVVGLQGGGKVTADDAMAYADSALYDAKEHGGDRIDVYSGQLSDSISWVQQIRGALAEERLVLHGQPIVDLATGEVTHHELLVRMLSDNGRDLVPPAVFIPAAERFGLIHELDRWVVGEGLRIARTRPVSINLSGYSTDQPGLIDSVRRAISSGLDPSHLTFELTETAMLASVPAAREFVTALQDLGAAIALDDFGTGFGSFTYLKHIPSQFLKIDLEFVREIATDRRDQQIVSSIVDVAHNLGKLTIAEGVESAAALAAVKRLGVDRAQGFHIGRPGPLRD